MVIATFFPLLVPRAKVFFKKKRKCDFGVSHRTLHSHTRARSFFILSFLFPPLYCPNRAGSCYMKKRHQHSLNEQRDRKGEGEYVTQTRHGLPVTNHPRFLHVHLHTLELVLTHEPSFPLFPLCVFFGPLLPSLFILAYSLCVCFLSFFLPFFSCKWVLSTRRSLGEG